MEEADSRGEWRGERWLGRNGPESKVSSPRRPVDEFWKDSAKERMIRLLLLRALGERAKEKEDTAV